MKKDKMIKLIEDMASAGYEIEEINKLNSLERTLGFGDIEMLLSLSSQEKSPLSKERMIKLVEILSSNNYVISIYERVLPDNHCGVYSDIKLKLQSVSFRQYRQNKD
jgi:hypothetical protein